MKIEWSCLKMQVNENTKEEKIWRSPNFLWIAPCKSPLSHNINDSWFFVGTLLLFHKSVSMSDVYKSEQNSCYNSTSDNVGSPGQIFIVISVSASFIVMLSLLLLTLCSAIQVAKKLSSTSLNVDTYVEPDVIVVEESKDLTSQNSNQQLTLNSRDLLDEFYEKLPSSENSDNNHIQM